MLKFKYSFQFILIVFLFTFIDTDLYSQAPLSNIKIDLNYIPFSRYGSYMVVSEREGNIYIRDASGNKLWTDNRVFLLEPLADGNAVKAKISATALSVTMTSDKGSIDICFERADILRIRGKGVGLRITQLAKDHNSVIIPVKEGQWRLQQGGNAHYVCTTLSGTPSIIGSSSLHEHKSAEEKANLVKMIYTVNPDTNNSFDIALEQYASGWKPKTYEKTYEDAFKNVSSEFSTWLTKTPHAPKYLEEARLLSAYIDWSCVVNKRGFMTRTTMFTSKNNMHAIWSWDHCFNALATSYYMPDFAWDQIMIMVDYQNEQGAFPDYVNDRNAIWGYVKPPVHGWILRKMEKAHPGILTSARKKQIYGPLSKWTNFWFEYQDDDRNGIPQYNHGNDSGWDNGTLFDIGYSVEGADLCAYLVIQMDLLADLAKDLNKPEESKAWKNRSDKLLAAMIKRFWNGEKFVSKRTGEDTYNEKSQSLMSYLPIVLGTKLPENIRKKMIADLKNPDGNLTAFGLASESPKSPFYMTDGYWRGPIWAPTTMIITMGIRDSGDNEFATEIAKRFCTMCSKSYFSENFDALTGKGLRDSALPWSASNFQILSHEFLK